MLTDSSRSLLPLSLHPRRSHAPPCAPPPPPPPPLPCWPPLPAARAKPHECRLCLPAAPQPQWRREEWMRGWQQSSGPDFPPPPPGEIPPPWEGGDEPPFWY
mmetsp:Transcript_25568/g.82032  ORF Transcript_25568/g.82032 Transcript_25568/m.82032 type:complete len:102 (+) Transcript_25568:540-845(+)